MFYEDISALPSWYGYLYQGQIALILTLETILKKMSNGNSIKNLVLELEHIEDFSIKENEQYISIHQVKSGKTVSLSEADIFNFAIIYFDKKPENGYYHAISRFDPPDNQIPRINQYIRILKKSLLKLSKSVNIDDINNYIKTLTKNEKEIFGISKDKLFTDESKLIYGNAKKGTLLRFLYNQYKVLKNSNKDTTKNIETVRNISNQMLEYIDYISLKIENHGTNDILHQYKEIFDICEKISDKTKDLIRRILNKNDITKEEVNYIFNELCNFFLKKIFQAKETNKSYVRITFCEIYDCLKFDYTDILNNLDIQARLYKENFIEQWENFPKQKSYGKKNCVPDSCQECNARQQNCNTYQQIENICNINNFADFISNIILFKAKKKGDWYEFPDKTKLKNMLFKFLKEFKQFSLNDSLITTIHNGLNYRLTLKNTDDIHQLSDDISENFQDLIFPMETDVIITEHLDNKDLYWQKNNIFTPNPEMYKSLNNSGVKRVDLKEKSENIIHPKKIKVINVNRAREELK